MKAEHAVTGIKRFFAPEFRLKCALFAVVSEFLFVIMQLCNGQFSAEPLPWQLHLGFALRWFTLYIVPNNAGETGYHMMWSIHLLNAAISMLLLYFAGYALLVALPRRLQKKTR